VISTDIDISIDRGIFHTIWLTEQDDIIEKGRTAPSKAIGLRQGGNKRRLGSSMYLKSIEYRK
jgi:hypothetical protein